MDERHIAGWTGIDEIAEPLSFWVKYVESHIRIYPNIVFPVEVHIIAFILKMKCTWAVVVVGNDQKAVPGPGIPYKPGVVIG